MPAMDAAEWRWKAAAAILVSSGALIGVASPLLPLGVRIGLTAAAAAAAAYVYRSRPAERLLAVLPFFVVVSGAWISADWYLRSKLEAPGVNMVWNYELLFIPLLGCAPGWILHELVQRIARRAKNVDEADEPARCSHCSAVVEPTFQLCSECGHPWRQGGTAS